MFSRRIYTGMYHAKGGIQIQAGCATSIFKLSFFKLSFFKLPFFKYYFFTQEIANQNLLTVNDIMICLLNGIFTPIFLVRKAYKFILTKCVNYVFCLIRLNHLSAKIWIWPSAVFSRVYVFGDNASKVFRDFRFERKLLRSRTNPRKLCTWDKTKTCGLLDVLQS